MAKEGLPFNGDSFMQKEFLKLKKDFWIKCVIETGTYKGQTTEWLAQNFAEVYTCEVNGEFYREAEKRLSKYKNVTAGFGDSVGLMKSMLSMCEQPCLIFLDAHWYKNPLLGELEVIAESGIKPVLVIHDFKVPNRPQYQFDTYPNENIIYEFKYVEKALRKIYGKFNYNYNQESDSNIGCLFVTPH